MDELPPQEYLIKIEQLQPGVFIRLETSWFNHPFLFSKFKIRNDVQIQTLKKLGIKEVICIPEKSDFLPVPPEDLHTEPEPEKPQEIGQQEDPYIQLLWEVKKERLEKLNKKREDLRRCTKDYQDTMKKVSAVMINLVTGSPEAVSNASVMMTQMVETFLKDADVIVHLINAKEKEEGVYYHSLNVCILSLMLGKKLNLTANEMHNIGMGGLFHDIGKNRIDRKVLRKQTSLTNAEKDILHLHPRYGVEILSRSNVFPKTATQVVYEHHEQIDGHGYPRGIKDKEISKLTRIVSIANVYDNLCNNPDPEKSLTPYQALSYMYTKYQTKLDMDLFPIFIRCLGIYPPGTIVKLNNDVIGIILSINPQNPLKPSLMLYDENIPLNEAVIFDMEDDPDVAIAQSLRPESLPAEIYNYLKPSLRINYYMSKDEGMGKLTASTGKSR